MAFRKPLIKLAPAGFCVLAGLAGLVGWKHQQIINLSYHYREYATILAQRLAFDPSQIDPAALKGPRLIAHAGGVADGLTHSNSLEALDESYRKGFRAFEIDLNWTSDGELVCVHDWDETATMTMGSPGQRSLEEFKKLRIRGRFTPLSLDDLAEWFARHPDAYLVTDAKVDNLKALERIRDRHPRLAARTIAQIYLFKEAIPAYRLGFERVILTLYRSNYPEKDLMRLPKLLPVSAITIYSEALRPGTIAALARIGVPTYLHTVNDAERARGFLAEGALGVYTDFLVPEGADPVSFRETAASRLTGATSRPRRTRDRK